MKSMPPHAPPTAPGPVVSTAPHTELERGSDRTPLSVALDVSVRTCDGSAVGTVGYAVVDPHTDKVSEFVLRTHGWLGRDVLVPRAEIEWAADDGGALRLRLGTRDLENLPTFHKARYATPPLDWSPLDSYGLPHAAYVWPLWGVAPRPDHGARTTPAGSGPVAETSASARAAAPHEAGFVAPTVRDGATVLDVGGTAIGVVENLEIDPANGRLEGVTFRITGTRRTLFGGGAERIRVSAAEIVESDDQLVRLNSTREAYDRQGP